MAKWCVCGGAVESLRGVKSGGCCGEGATAAKSEAAAAQGRASGACAKGSQGPHQDPAEAGLQGLDAASHARLQTFSTHTRAIMSQHQHTHAKNTQLQMLRVFQRLHTDRQQVTDPQPPTRKGSRLGGFVLHSNVVLF